MRAGIIATAAASVFAVIDTATAQSDPTDFGTSFVLNGVELTGLSVDKAVTLTGLLADGSVLEFEPRTTSSFGQDSFDAGSKLNVTLAALRPDPADFNGDGSLDVADIVAFLSAFFAGDASADFNDDGSLDVTDIVAFLVAFQTGR